MSRLRFALLAFCSVTISACLPNLSQRSYQKHLRNAESAYASRDFVQAEREYKTATDLARANASSSEEVIALRGTAQVFIATKRDTEAEAIFRQRIKLAENNLADQTAFMATTYDDLATFLLLRGRLTEAKPVYNKAISVRREAFGSNSADVKDNLKYYSELLSSLGYDNEAQELR